MELLVLVLEVLLLVLKLKLSPEEATRAIAEKYGIPFSKLWDVIPRKWK